ncbi:MAG: diphosphomevalonate decarboxylase [Deltaproteobacteria bacterium]|nr:diphosphomevalonate decarboxylase [Deltaproteobacteria bacterium]
MAEAYAHTNIALVKYWGKRPGPLNLPAVGSLSLTLDAFGTWTRVTPGAATDTLELNGAPQAGEAVRKVSAFLDMVRALAGRTEPAAVHSRNDVPTAAGLASSASAFAALAVAGCRAYGVNLDARALSALARRGSGSAARSLFGGFVLMEKGVREDGTDACAQPLPAGDGWPVRLVVAACAEGPKEVSSTDGMTHTQHTSPYFPAWVDTHDADLRAAADHVRTRDLERLGEVMEFSTLKMHASAMASRPGVIYWRGVSLEAALRVRQLRAAGTPAWFTMDAGPHVKVLTTEQDAPAVAAALREVPGVLRVQVAAPGPAARVLA